MVSALRPNLVLLVGVNHAHQYVNHPESATAKFSCYLEKICRARSVDLIAEEMNEDALQVNRTDSTARRLSCKLGTAHVLCDPNESERQALGIPSYEQLKQKHGFGKYLVDEQIKTIEQAEQSFWPIREAEWLRRLGRFESVNCLFILGSNHASSLSRLLAKQTIRNELLCTRWEP